MIEPFALALLRRRLPGLGAIPWLELGRFPTPVEPAGALGRELGVELWIKRDDLAASGYGGNKVRKLEPLLAAARERGARRVITVGGLGSNHVVATAFHARAAGLACEALLVPQPLTPLTRANLRAALALGARLLPAPGWAQAPGALLALARRLGRDAVVIGPGGSSPLGTLGYVAAALELEEQVRGGTCPAPAALYVALGSGGTAAGLLAGLAQTALPTRVVAVRVVHPALAGRWPTLLLARRTLALLRRHGARPAEVDPARLTIAGEQLGPGYGAPTAAAVAAVARAAAAGLVLETTYTGKTLAALIARAAAAPGPVLFWDTFSSADLAALAAPVGAVPAALAAILDGDLTSG
ncbi:MAG TPA: pyridoxal-phosphate dependent enzyme [Polyangia bacterium]